MAHLIVAADLTALGLAAASLGSSFDAGSTSSGLPSVGHAEGDAALADFADAMRGHASRLSAHAAAGASSLRGYAIAFHEAGA